MAHLSESFAAAMRAALAGEANSSLRYAYFAQIAEIEGHTEVAGVFSELAESVGCAVHGHLDVLRDAIAPEQRNDIGETRLNLASSVAEALESTTAVYPRLTAAAFEEGHADVASWLTTVAALKKRHTARLDAVLTELTRTTGQDDLGGTPVTEDLDD